MARGSGMCKWGTLAPSCARTNTDEAGNVRTGIPRRRFKSFCCRRNDTPTSQLSLNWNVGEGLRFRVEQRRDREARDHVPATEGRPPTGSLPRIAGLFDLILGLWS